MPKTKILVTGANGFIGRALIEGLAKDRFDIFALDIKKPRHIHPCIRKFYRQDITKPFLLKESFDFVIHLAAYNVTHVGRKDRAMYGRVNVLGTLHMIEAARTKNFILMSTAKVYRCEGKPIDETSPLNPKNDYEKSKLEAEIICQKYIPGNQLTIFRSVNIVGPGQADKAILPVLFKKAFKNDPLEIFAPKRSFLQLLYVGDVVRALELLVKKGGAGGIYNLSSIYKMRMDELALKITHLCHSSSEVYFSNFSRAAFSPVKSTKAKKTLSWVARFDIDRILKIYHKALASSHGKEA